LSHNGIWRLIKISPFGTSLYPNVVVARRVGQSYGLTIVMSSDVRLGIIILAEQNLTLQGMVAVEMATFVREGNSHDRTNC